MEKKTLFIFVDESGNFDFSPTGTKYFILTATSTSNPTGKEELEKIKYNLLRKGFDIEYFHASENKQIVRDKVFEFIGNLNDIEIDSVVVQKNKGNPLLYEEKKESRVKHKGDILYRKVLQTLLQYIFNRYGTESNINNVIVILSSIFTKNKRELILKIIKKYLKNFPTPFHIYFHNSRSDKNSQIVDYCCWAIYRKWEDGEVRPYNTIGNGIKSEFDIFEKGDDKYYEYKN